MRSRETGSGTGAFAAAGFGRDRLEQVPETFRTSLADFLAQADTFRRADSTMRTLTEEEFLRGKERLRQAARDAGRGYFPTGCPSGACRSSPG